MNEARYEMEERIDEMFGQLMKRDGYESWWSCEDVWDSYEEEIIAAGIADEEVVHEYFAQMAEDI